MAAPLIAGRTRLLIGFDNGQIHGATSGLGDSATGARSLSLIERNDSPTDECTLPMTNIEVNTDEALQRFLTITEIPGHSGDEAAVAGKIVDLLREAGLDESAIAFDGA